MLSLQMLAWTVNTQLNSAILQSAKMSDSENIIVVSDKSEENKDVVVLPPDNQLKAEEKATEVVSRKPFILPNSVFSCYVYWLLVKSISN